jgi:hypothetical protein
LLLPSLGNVGTFGDFAGLKTALDLLNETASSPTTIETYAFTATIAGTSGSYLWIQDNQSQYDQRDLMFQTATLGQIGAGDILLG